MKAQADAVAIATYHYLDKKAEQDYFEATLVSAQEGDSEAKKMRLAQATEAWKSFHRSMARLEGLKKLQELRFKVMELDFQAQYLEQKQEALFTRGQT